MSSSHSRRQISLELGGIRGGTAGGEARGDGLADQAEHGEDRYRFKEDRGDFFSCDE
jgi:hypothetical protein